MAQYDPRQRTSAPASQRTTSSAFSTQKPIPPRISHEAISKRAYEKFLARGGKHGFDRQDWLEAERELQREANRN